MKKQRYVCLGISMILLGMAGCAAKDNQTVLTPTPTETIREVVFEKGKDVVVSSKEIITKTDGLCEKLEETNNRETMYNSFNRMINVEGEDGFSGTGTSLFCIDEKTGVIYFVNQGKDCFLYRMKEGEVALAVAMPVKDIYPYEGSIYFMIEDYDKYELQGMHNGDIYCYTPASGAVELVYATDVIEDFRHGNLYVEESGIYFRYVKKDGTGVEEDKELKYLNYYLPFGEKEPVEDTKQMVQKGWGNYFFNYSSEWKWELVHRTPNEDGIRETLEIPEMRGAFCMVGDVLYFKEKGTVFATNLKTGERTEYDFFEEIKENTGEEIFEQSIKNAIDTFVITEDALWILVFGSGLYRMDLQTGEILVGHIQYKDSSYLIIDLYTDGTKLYGFGVPMEDWDGSHEKGSVVHLIPERIDIYENNPGIIDVEILTE